MAFRLPRLPQWEPSHAEMQIWWQQVVEAIERQEATQDEIIAEIQVLVAELEAQGIILTEAVADITAILIAVGLAQTTADEGLALAESAIEVGGTIKDSKVLTNSIAPSNVTRVDPVLQVGTTALIADALEHTLLTNTVDTIPAGATGIMVTASAYFDDPTDNTLKARFRLYKNGVEQAKDFKRNDGTSTLIEVDLAPVAGDIWHTTYTREGEDFYVSRGQLIFAYFDR
jgi:hypothetical protein